MRRYMYETTVSTTPDRLYLAIADISRWPEWDDELERTMLRVPVKTGSAFTLKPKGTPKV
jgi:hypothetical protein